MAAITCWLMFYTYRRGGGRAEYIDHDEYCERMMAAVLPSGEVIYR